MVMVVMVRLFLDDYLVSGHGDFHAPQGARRER